MVAGSDAVGISILIALLVMTFQLLRSFGVAKCEPTMF
jgi:hypothetical protein